MKIAKKLRYIKILKRKKKEIKIINVKRVSVNIFVLDIVNNDTGIRYDNRQTEIMTTINKLLCTGISCTKTNAQV